MSCVLRIIGENFDVDAFVIKSNIEFDNKTYKGSPRFKTKPEGQKMPHSVLSISVSNADFDSFDEQISDVKLYLQKNSENLKHIVEDENIQHAFIDFGLHYNTDNAVNSIYLPADIVFIAGRLGIGFQFSLYNTEIFE